MRHCLPLIAHSRETKWVPDESRSTGSAERAGVREHVRPSQTHAEEVVANAPGENFPVALRVLPARHRRHLTNLYFFARLTDDLGDEARDTQADVSTLRLQLLDLIEANRQDQKVTRYDAFAELTRYCELSANPVGQIVLYIFGAATRPRI